MVLSTRFSLGQTVYRIGRAKMQDITLPCKFCRGSGQARAVGAGDSSRSVTCPDCRGKGSQKIHVIEIYACLEPAQVGKLEVVRVDRTVPGFNGGSGFDEESERYMLSSSGFPSGSVFGHIDLFATQLEANEACEERNEAIAEGRFDARSKPSREAADRARSFLAHRDVYEHTDEDVALAYTVIAAFEYEPDELTTSASGASEKDLP